MAEELKAAGISTAEAVVRDALAAGRSVEEIRDALKTWQANRSRLGPGALVYFLRTRAWPDPNVVEADALEARRRASAARDADRQAQAQADDDARARDLAELAELEAAHGPAYSALEPAALAELIARTWPDKFSRDYARKHPRAFPVRLALLRTLAHDHALELEPAQCVT